MLSNKFVKNIFYILFIVGILTVAIIYHQKEQKKLLADNHLTSAKIVSWEPARKGGGVWISYEYTVNNAKYMDQKLCRALSKLEAPALLNKYLQLMYETKDPNNHVLLLSKEQYEFYNVVLPDSIGPCITLINED